MKRIYQIFLFLFTVLVTSCKNQPKKEVPKLENDTIYQFTVEDIDGKPFSFEELKGKKIMIVNTASKCGLTPQYEKLEELYQNYKDKNFVIIGFPANNFLFQEPGSNQEIKQFCSSKFQISFPMMSKISVKGKDIAPIYQFLTLKSLNGKEDSSVKWNFQKYLIGTNGKLEKVIGPKTSPMNPAIISWINSQS